MNWFSSFSFWVSQAIQHPFWRVSFIVGVIIISVATFLVFLMCKFRKAAINPTNNYQTLISTPMITVVMCCKGKHSESYNNFKRNLDMKYPGKVEFIFVVESEDDPAVEEAQKAINDTEFENPENRSARIEVAGLSFHNAQKCHNMLFGVCCSSPESQFVLFPDDDVFLYPGLIDELLVPLIDESDKVAVSTGYEFIAPQPGSSIACYSLLMYRMHNLFSFLTTRPVLCWGGCWCAPIRLFKENFANLVDCYIDGGYSDDTIVSCLIQQNGYVCAHPYRATFPNQPNPELKFSQYFEFLKRQMFVLDTYSTEYNHRVNHSLAYLIATSIWIMVVWDFIAPIVVAISVFALPFGAFEVSTNYYIAVSICFVWLIFLLSLRHVTNIMLKSANSVRPPNSQVQMKFNLIKMYFGLMFHLLSMPVAMVMIMIQGSIVWSKVRYYKKGGKIYKVERKDSGGAVVTIPADESIARFLKTPQYKAFFPKGPLKSV